MKLIPIISALILCFPALAQVNTDFENAKTAFDNGNLDAAYIHLKNSLDKDASHLPSKILMGKALAISFYYEDAILEFEESLDAGADANLIIVDYANALLVTKQYETILGLSAKGLTQENESILNTLQAKSHNALGNTQKAAQLFDKVVRISNNPDVLVSAARFKIQQENYDEAQTLLDNALSKDAFNTETLRTQATLYNILGDTDRYVIALESAIAADENQPLVLRDLISAYLSSGKLEQASDLLDRVLVSAPDDPMAQFLSAWVLTQKGDFDNANVKLEELVNYLSLIDDELMQDADGLVYISGMSNYAINNFEAASQDLEKYLAKRPNDLNASLLLADIYSQEGNYTTAANLLEKFQEIALEDLNFGNKLCTIYLQADANHKCNWLILQMEKSFAGNPEFIALKAKALASRGKLDEALKELDSIGEDSEGALLSKTLLSIQANRLVEGRKLVEKLLAKQPANNDYKNLQASIDIKEAKLETAENTINEILESNNSHYSARFNLASIRFRQAQYDDAFTLLSTLVAERPNDITTLLLKSRVLRQLERFDEAKDQVSNILLIDSSYIPAKLELAELYELEGQYEDAIAIVTQLLKNSFLNARYLDKRANLYLAQGNLAAARKDLLTLFSLYKDNSFQLLDLMLLQKRADDFANARKSIERAISISPDEYVIRREYTKLLIQTFDMQLANKELEKLYQDFPVVADTDVLKGDYLVGQKKLEQASNYYLDAVEKQNLFAQAMAKSYQLAQLGYNEKRFAKLFESIITDDERSDLARNLLGDYYSKNGMFTLAKQHYSQIIKNNSYTFLPIVMNNLANIYLQEEKINTAYDLANKAYILSPNNANILDTLGWTLSLQGKYDEALSLLRKSFAMNTATPDVRYHIAYTLAKLGRKADAQTELENLLQLFESFSYKEEASALLKQLKS
ncbi:XrtA/PEP-CTERM system TPR-repeat protein PrsT [Brumicola blandensis]|jgi:putative PEP-CTERM system TPR-repeat lipoprotein|uniref:PEP-CTERM system TPR-repeat protein PrsT n=1 Tax=Brumicola blandensis TaxID=3075611 RepID=A0AAW8R7J3_9ALTE|nr:XrtA/PEP-CTERM system TPR-repeat protein PrsT [Alteromonas sp. W409]MDT0583885.1 PEP-CTERM system TPR-repeat protein PrsT [Alteromonas sp. W409]